MDSLGSWRPEDADYPALETGLLPAHRLVATVTAVAVNQAGLVPPLARPEPERDRWGRYLIPDPVSGQKQAWTRATTWAETVADTFALTNWKLRMTAIGLAARPDLLTGVAAVLDPDTKDGKRSLDKLVERAQEAAKASARATLGTALHSFCEAHDSGRELPLIPPPFDADLEAYQRAMSAVKVSRNYIEKIGIIRELGVAGTMDRVVAFHHSKRPMIGDIKTGRDLSYSWTEIAIQLALYAHADTIWDVTEEVHRPMLEVDQERALVVHLPAGEARCQLYIVDIAAGWEMAQVCGQVRAWRARKDLAQPLLAKEAKP